MACVNADDLTATRSRMRSLLLPDQRRIHFTHEKDGRRRSILTELQQMGITAFIVSAPKSSGPILGRERCLGEVAAFAAQLRVVAITVERDDSVAALDRRVLYRALHRQRPDIIYRHERAYDEPLLWAADALAWSWAKGGAWRELVRPMLRRSVGLGP